MCRWEFTAAKQGGWYGTKYFQIRSKYSHLILCCFFRPYLEVSYMPSFWSFSFKEQHTSDLEPQCAYYILNVEQRHHSEPLAIALLLEIALSLPFINIRYFSCEIDLIKVIVVRMLVLCLGNLSNAWKRHNLKILLFLSTKSTSLVAASRVIQARRYSNYLIQVSNILNKYNIL